MLTTKDKEQALFKGQLPLRALGRFFEEVKTDAGIFNDGWEAT